MKCGKNHTKTAHIESRRLFFDWLTANIHIPGVIAVDRDHGFDNNDLFSAGIRLTHPRMFNSGEGLKEGILLEVGFDDTTSNQPVDVSSWAVDKAAAVGVEFIDNRALAVKCYDPAYKEHSKK